MTYTYIYDVYGAMVSTWRLDLSIYDVYRAKVAVWRLDISIYEVYRAMAAIWRPDLSMSSIELCRLYNAYIYIWRL